MKTPALNLLSEAIGDFISFLKSPEKQIWKRNDEADPADIDLSFQPEAPLPVLDTLQNPGACTLCERRISYKPGQFHIQAPTLPYLILVHNSFQQTSSRVFHHAESDEVFQKIIEGVLGYSADNFLIRDPLRCHFGKEEVGNPEWFANCVSHIIDDLERWKIKGILVMGEAATLVEKNKDELKKRIGKVTEFCSLPAVFTPGPTRLVFLRQNKYPSDKINEERRKIFAAVKIFKDQVMNC